jgi:hypothetical protein
MCHELLGRQKAERARIWTKDAYVYVESASAGVRIFSENLGTASKF